MKITETKKKQFNKMLNALKKISRGYQTPEQLRKASQGDFGLDFDEAIEMAYENIQSEAKQACKGISELK